MPSNTEIELKLVLDAAALRRLPKLPIIARHSAYKPITRRLRSTYYDTPELALQQHGVAVRLRRDGRRSLQTIKLAGESGGGLHQRREWEAHTPGHALDLTLVDEPELRDVLQRAALRGALQPVFETDFRRTQRILRFDADEIELSIDRGAVRAHDKTEPICEVELELKAGGLARLFEVAQALNDALPLRLEARSKAERGYRLFAAARETPRKAATAPLARDMTVGDAFAAIAQSCLAHLQANEPGVLGSDDSEYLHQMRVALRRLRSAISVFGQVIPRAASAAVVAELRWLAGELNDARNWDVFVAETLPPILDAHAGDPGLARLHEDARALQHASRQRARAAVTSPRYQTLLLNIGHWLAAQAWDAHALRESLAAPIAHFASATLDERHQRLRKRGKHLAQLNAQERHRVRIAAKKLRYAAEFFAHLHAKRGVHNYVAALSDLQDVLGALNDAATTATLLDVLAKQSGDAMSQRALGVVQGWVMAYISVRIKELDVTWLQFKKTARFW